MTQKKKTKSVSSLVASAAALHGIAFSPLSLAEGPQPESEAGIAFYNYRDRQESGSRMKVLEPMLYARSTINEHTSIQGSFILDSMSGASPLYHDTLSGASGKGIVDHRHAEDLSVSHSFDKFQVTVGIGDSHEDDYTSFGESVEVSVPINDGNTTVSIGTSHSDDDVSSTNDTRLQESKTNNGAGIGITQLLSPSSLVQSNVTFASSNGYLSDPYKTFDLRPRSRDQWAWLTRFVNYFPDLDAAVHFDYRFYRDSWEINAHTFEVSWYQNLGEKWSLIPHIRYYSQGKAEFFVNEFPPEEPGANFYSADERMAGFGSITTGMQLSRSITDSVSLTGSFDYMQQQGGWRVFYPGSPNLEPVKAAMIGFGMRVAF